MSEQSRLESAVESTCQITVGFLISWALMGLVIGPLYEYNTSAGDAFAITCIFTVTSWIRQYFLRRWFANGLYNAIRGWLRRGK